MNKPPGWSVALSFAASAAAMGGALYFAGQDQMPIALTGTLLFVILGGVGFELAKRRSA
ncbi:MAG: hypothetical protein Q8L86_02075 [Vicinamibacterales bacterium]|nr:hypothetical protein [Vicinamibacterales bacterium]